MSEFQGTPGPWCVDTTFALGAYGVWTDYPHPENPGHDGAGYAVQICSMTVDGWLKSPISKSERNANAALLAAAPDLLASAVRLRGAMSRYDLDGLFGHDEEMLNAMQSVDDAVAKATT